MCPALRAKSDNLKSLPLIIGRSLLLHRRRGDPCIQRTPVVAGWAAQLPSADNGLGSCLLVLWMTL